MANLLVSLDIDALWKLWIFVSIMSFVIIDVSRILYDCVKGEFATINRKRKSNEAYLARWNWTPTAKEAAKLAADVAESKRLIAAYNKKQRQAMLAAASNASK